MNEQIISTSPGFILILLVAVFTLASVVMASATLMNKIRLRNVRLNWKAGKLKGYPIFSTLFLLFSICLFAVAFYRGPVLDWITFLLYFWMSGGWFLTSYLASKRYITDNGIVKNINDPSQSIQWFQIRDYVEQDSEHGRKYIFLYKEDEANSEAHFIRLELKVPQKHMEAFQRLISHKLGRRVSDHKTRGIDLEQFDLK